MPGRSPREWKQRLRGRAKGRLQRPLEARTPASRRHPEGLPRCAYWDIRDGAQWQCPRPARTGCRTCGVHGGGYEKREREGRAVNPKAAPIVTGEHATVDAKAAFLARYPELAALYEHHVSDPHLLDLRPQIAWAKTLAEHYMRAADLGRTRGPAGGGLPEVLHAIDALRQVGRLARDFTAVEKARGPIFHDDLQRLCHTFGVTLARYVPANRIAEAKEFLRAELAGPLLRVALGSDGHGAGANGAGRNGADAP